MKSIMFSQALLFFCLFVCLFVCFLLLSSVANCSELQQVIKACKDL